MTMLVSMFAAEGIVFAADRQIVYKSPSGGTARHAQGHRRKVFRIPRMGIGRAGVVGHWGLAQVRTQPMSEWLPGLAAAWPGGSVEDFAYHLRDALEQQTTSAERKNESGFHVAGFERREDATIPVCRVVRNVTDHDPQTGLYTTNLGYWEANEHIPRGNLDHVKLGTFRRSLREHQRHQGVPYWLRNGDLPDFSKPQNAIHTAARKLINTPRFAAPTQLIHWQRLAEIMVGTAASLYGIYYTAGAPTVEGRAHAVAIPWPDPG